MSDEDIVRQAMADWDQGGFDAFAKHLAEDVEWHAPPEYPEGSVWQGREELIEAWHAQFDSVFETRGMRLVEFEQVSPVWYADARATGREKRSGMELQLHTYFVGRLEEGLYKEVRVFTDRKQAREAAGLDP